LEMTKLTQAPECSWVDPQRHDDGNCGRACQASSALRWSAVGSPPVPFGAYKQIPQASTIIRNHITCFIPLCKPRHEDPADSVRYCYLPISKIRSRHHPCPHYKLSSCGFLLLSPKIASRLPFLQGPQTLIGLFFPTLNGTNRSPGRRGPMLFKKSQLRQR
jgi:hypothetical protein